MSNKNKKTARPYPFSDAEAIQVCHVTHGMLAEDLTVFNDFEKRIDATFLTNWTAAIQAAIDFPQDGSFEADLELLKQNRDNAMGLALIHYARLMYFVRQAYPGNKEMHVVFGLGQLAKVRANGSKLSKFLGVVLENVNKHIAELTAPEVDYKPAQLAALTDKMTELQTAQRLYSAKRIEQRATTKERISLLRAMWEYQILVGKVAKIIFFDNYAKYKNYLLPKRAKKKEDEPQITND